MNDNLVTVGAVTHTHTHGHSLSGNFVSIYIYICIHVNAYLGYQKDETKQKKLNLMWIHRIKLFCVVLFCLDILLELL